MSHEIHNKAWPDDPGSLVPHPLLILSQSSFTKSQTLEAYLSLNIILISFEGVFEGFCSHIERDTCTSTQFPLALSGLLLGSSLGLLCPGVTADPLTTLPPQPYHAARNLQANIRPYTHHISSLWGVNWMHRVDCVVQKWKSILVLTLTFTDVTTAGLGQVSGPCLQQPGTFLSLLCPHLHLQTFIDKTRQVVNNSNGCKKRSEIVRIYRSVC